MTFVAGGDKHEHVERVLGRGEPLTIAERAPAWFNDATRGAEFTFDRLRQPFLERGDFVR